MGRGRSSVRYIGVGLLGGFWFGPRRRTGYEPVIDDSMRPLAADGFYAAQRLKAKAEPVDPDEQSLRCLPVGFFLPGGKKHFGGCKPARVAKGRAHANVEDFLAGLFADLVVFRIQPRLQRGCMAIISESR